MDKYDHLIIGAGIAGLSTAFFLKKEGAGSVCLIEREERIAQMASAKSAEMLCQIVRDSVTCRLMIESVDLIKSEWLGLSENITYTASSSHHIGLTQDIAVFEESLKLADEMNVPVRVLNRAEAIKQCTYLDQTSFEKSIYCESDGIVDAVRLTEALSTFLTEQKGVIRCGSQVVSIKKEADIFHVTLEDGRVIYAQTVVNAAGAWADQVAQAAGIAAIGLQPTRRHVFAAESSWPLQELPIVWDVTRDAYFRPAQSDLLLCGCDEEPHDAKPSDVSSSARDYLEDKLAAFLPSMTGFKQTRVWSGLRTFSKDKRFVIGEDKALPNFFWNACLGGYGITASAGAGKLTADLMLKKDVYSDYKEYFSPGRF